jgi:hypothetical protein
MFCWHKWTKWELFTIELYKEGFKNKEGNFIKGEWQKQRRRCIKCGKWQEEYL